MRKPSRKTLVRNLDKVTAEVVKLRDDYTCQRCMKKCSGFGAHWSHIYSRSRYSMRWDLLNSVCMCAGCHLWYHGYPTMSGEWFKKKWPHRYDYLQAERKKPLRPIKDWELAEWLAERKQKLEELKK